jgi:hypothetical protein
MARENKSLRLSRARLDAAGLNCGGSKSDSTSDIKAGGSGCEGTFEAELLGTRESNVRRRAAGVSSGKAFCGEWEELGGAKGVLKPILV